MHTHQNLRQRRIEMGQYKTVGHERADERVDDDVEDGEESWRDSQL
jgi:hypothetical protein